MIFHLDRSYARKREFKFCASCPIDPTKQKIVYRDKAGNFYCCIECSVQHRKKGEAILVTEEKP